MQIKYRLSNQGERDDVKEQPDDTSALHYSWSYSTAPFSQVTDTESLKTLSRTLSRSTEAHLHGVSTS